MPADSSATLGPRLRSLRLGAGLSQTDLSERSGIPKPTISRYENDHVSPSLQTLERLALALGVAEAAILPSTSPQDAFLHALAEHGVTFSTVEEAQRLGADVAAELKRRPGIATD